MAVRISHSGDLQPKQYIFSSLDRKACHRTFDLGTTCAPGQQHKQHSDSPGGLSIDHKRAILRGKAGRARPS